MLSSKIYFRFVQALNILNAALEAHRSNSDLSGFLLACDRELEGHDLLVEVVDESSQPLGRYTIRWREGVFVLVSRDPEPGELAFEKGLSETMTRHVAWKVSSQTLDDLIDHARLYINDPLRLDLNWLRACLSDANCLSQSVRDSLDRSQEMPVRAAAIVAQGATGGLSASGDAVADTVAPGPRKAR